MSYNNIPQEMRAYNQWVVWKEVTLGNGRRTKVPYDPKQQRLASVTDPATWSDYDTAVGVALNMGMGLGFVFTEYDPFTGVDCDNPYEKKEDGTYKYADPEAVVAMQKTFVEGVQSYSELSPSGKGLHVILRGSVTKGVRRNGIEVYSSGRFFTMTGNVWGNYPIVENQPAIDWLYGQLGGTTQAVAFQGTFEDKEPDEIVYQRAAGAENGQKFVDLWNGDWQRYYGEQSQSEADMALVNILAFYTTSRFQIARMFRASALGQREKAGRDTYINYMLQKCFDRHLPPVDIEGLREKLELEFGMQTPASETTSGSRISSEEQGHTAEPTATSTLTIGDNAASGNPYLAPIPGLVGEVARWVYNRSPRPVAEIAIATALALVSGIAGRAYNVSGTGLNQYILVLAPTGRGKEMVTIGVNSLMAAVSEIGPGKGGCPAGLEFVGPERISSGQALIKYLDKRSRSFVTVMGEFDNTLKSFTAKNANSALLALRQNLLALYGRSGRGNAVNPTIYSDNDKNTSVILSPAVTLIGEGTPDRFYSLLDESMVSDGLLPRFTIIEYNGERPPLNEVGANLEPYPDLVRRLAELCGQCLMLNQSNSAHDIEYTEEGKGLLDAFNVEADGLINGAHNETIAELWNRAHLKALKIAGVLAVGVNWGRPVIGEVEAQYAINAVRYDTQRMVAKFEAGDIGEGDTKQIADMRGVIRKYVSGEVSKYDAVNKYKIPPQAYDNKVISLRFISARCMGYASFRNDRMGASSAINKVIKVLTDTGVLIELSSTHDKENAIGQNLRARWFAVGDL